MTVSKSQLACSESFTLHYFGVKGAVSVTLIALEQGEVPYAAKNWGMDFEAWSKFKPSTPTGLMPLMEFKGGKMIAESGACARYAAAQGGLLGEGQDFATSECVIGMVADMWKVVAGNAPTVMTVANFTDEQKTKWETEYKPKVKEHLNKFAALLVGAGKDRFTERGDVLGEFELWFRLYQLINGGYADALTDVPALKPFYERVSGMQGPSKFAADKSKFGELAHYFVPVPK